MENSETTGVGRFTNSTYLLDNAGREAPGRFAALSAPCLTREQSAIWRTANL